MIIVLLWPLLAAVLAVGYVVWSASFAEWMYLKALGLYELERAFGRSHKLTLDFTQAGHTQRAFVEDVLTYLTAFPDFTQLLSQRLVGSVSLALCASLAIYGLVGSKLSPAATKRHIRGAQNNRRTQWSPLHRRIGYTLALGFLLALAIWCGLAAIRLPEGFTMAMLFKNAFLSIDTANEWAMRSRTLLSAGLGYLLAGVLLFTGSSMGRWVGTFAKARKIPWPGAPITIGGIPVRFEDETRGFLITGRPGSGKTLLMREMLRGFRYRGDRGLIADPDGSYLSVFARAGDRILNPFDARSERWSPFAEIRDDNDFELLAKAVVPVSESATEEEWRGYARTLLAAILRSLHREGRSNANEVVRTINSAAGDEELEALLAGTNAAGLRRHEALFNSVIGVLAPRIASWSFLIQPDQKNPAFSIRDWIRSSVKGRGEWLYLTYRDDQREALQSLTATWVSLAMTEMLSLPENLKHRVVCALDEFDSLGKIGSLEFAPPMLRKHGGVLIIGLHTKAQPDRTYGMAGSQVIMSSVAHKVALGLGDHETASYFEKELGNHEIERVRTTQGSGTSTTGGTRSQSVSRDFTTEPVIMASELMGLPDRSGYFRPVGSSQIHKIRVPLVKMRTVVPAFEPRK